MWWLLVLSSSGRNDKTWSDTGYSLKVGPRKVTEGLRVLSLLCLWNNTFNSGSLLILDPSFLTWIFIQIIFHSSSAKMTWSLWINNWEKPLQFHMTAASQIRNVKIIHSRVVTTSRRKLDKINWKLVHVKYNFKTNYCY